MEDTTDDNCLECLEGMKQKDLQESKFIIGKNYRESFQLALSLANSMTFIIGISCTTFVI